MHWSWLRFSAKSHHFSYRSLKIGAPLTIVASLSRMLERIVDALVVVEFFSQISSLFLSFSRDWSTIYYCSIAKSHVRVDS